MEIQKILTRYDSYLNMGKLKDAEALLLLSLQDAEEEGLYGARLTLLNELEGMYRTTGRARQAMEISEKALALISVLGLTGQEPHAVTLLNGATACRAAEKMKKHCDVSPGGADPSRSWTGGRLLNDSPLQ